MKKELFLTDLELNQEGEIISIMGGSIATKRLADLGLISGTNIKVINKAPFSGPIKIEVRGSRLVLGRGLASKILVKVKQDEK